MGELVSRSPTIAMLVLSFVVSSVLSLRVHSKTGKQLISAVITLLRCGYWVH